MLLYVCKIKKGLLLHTALKGKHLTELNMGYSLQLDKIAPSDLGDIGIRLAENREES